MPRFVPRERKHRKLARQNVESNTPTGGTADSNTVQLPASASNPDQDEKRAKRRQMQAELRAPDQKVSSKKRKRLDKYIDSKLKREENLELLKKLEAQKVDTGLLQSSKKLGRRQESKRERFERALNERDAGVDVDGSGEAILFENRQENSGRDIESDDGEETSAGAAAPFTVVQSSAPQPSAPIFGSGLKRPLKTDDNGQPILKKRKRRKRGKMDPLLLKGGSVATDTDEEMDEEEDANQSEDSAEGEWTGFSDGGSDGASNSAGDDDHSADEHEDEDDSEGRSEISGASDDEDDSMTSDDSDDENESEDEEKPERMSAFKAWANSQRNEAIGFTPSALPVDSEAVKAQFKPRLPSPDPMLKAIPTAADGAQSERPKSAVTVPRTEEVQSARLELPVVQEEQRIMEAIHNNPVVVVCGATGSGKTTQVPQMLFENGYGSMVSKDSKEEARGLVGGMIGVTQPRRVAATSVASRVSYEMGESHGKKVAHQVRYDTNVSKETAIKFMTDGILLREIQHDFILSKYSAIVVDEAHERSVNTDILVGMLSRIVDLRAQLAHEEPEKYYALKLVVMSATLRVEDFLHNEKLFRNGPPPVVEAEGRQFPVTVHFSRKTNRDYVEETVAKIARGHKKLPPGGMLVFLTGQQEIQTVAKRLRERLGGSAAVAASEPKTIDDGQMPLDVDDFDGMSQSAGKRNEYLEDEDASSDSDSDAEINGVDNDEDDEEFAVEEDVTQPRGPLKPHILPLFAALPPAQQLRVFQPAPEGSRSIILATNVAETSLTIPGIRYVFDSGRSKEKIYDTSTGVQNFEVDWISKASASQRTGRAGRTGPGHCWRLYSSAIFEQYFAEHSVPEILRTPLESTVLQLKAMEIANVVNFPYPTPPDRSQLAQAERMLMNLGAIEEQASTITDVGKEILRYPVSPRFGKMLVLASKNGIVDLVISLVAGLAVGDLFIPEAQRSQAEVDDDPSDHDADDSEDDLRLNKQAATRSKLAADKRHQTYTRAQATLSRRDDQSDAVKLLTAVAAHADAAKTSEKASTFCADFFLREKGMSEVQQLRQQLHAIVRASSGRPVGAFKPQVSLPTEKERAMLNQVAVGGFVDQVAIRADMLQDDGTGFGRKPRRAIEVPYRTLFPSSAALDRSASPQDQEMQRSVFLHPASVLAKLSVNEMPQYIAYSHLSRAAPASLEGGATKKTRMHPLTAVGPKALAALTEGTALLEMGKPVGKLEDLPRDAQGAQRRQCWVGVFLRAPGGVGGDPWPLGAWKVIQKRGKRDWDVEKVVAR